MAPSRSPAHQPPRLQGDASTTRTSRVRAAYPRMARSRVTSGTSCSRAVATRQRSTGSGSADAGTGPASSAMAAHDVYVSIAVMKRTTIYLEPDLEVRLKVEMLRRKQPMAELIREALRAFLTREPHRAPPGAGAFASRLTDTAERAEAVLAETGFGASHTAKGASRRKKP